MCGAHAQISKPAKSHIEVHRSAEIGHTFWSSDIRSVWVRIQTLYCTVTSLNLCVYIRYLRELFFSK